MAKKRITRKQLLKEPDEFISLTGRGIRWARENSRILGYIAVAMVLVLVVVAVTGYLRDRREHAAAALLSQAIGAYQKAGEQESDPVVLLAAAKPDMERLVTQYRRYPAGRLGKVLYGHLQLAAGDLDGAIAHYEKALGQFSKDPALRAVILNGLAEAHSQRGESEAAIARYEQIVAGRELHMVDSALFHLGRLYRMAGDMEKSRAAYQRLGTDFPGSIYADMVREQTAG